MSSGSGPNSALDGADTPLWLALRPPSDVDPSTTFITGKFYAERGEKAF
jgi:hypothetical protein